MSKQIDALKLALEALEKLRMSSWAELKAAFEYADLAIPCIREALADSALERMAENARELGLDYEPAQQQEPVFTFGEVERTMQALKKGTLEQQQAYEAMKDKPLYTSSPASKPWVGLTDEEFQWIYDHGRTPAGMMELAEAKLREKNA